MTTFAVPPFVPPAGSPVWREVYLTPPDVRVGRWCPIDDTTLQIRLDGWSCPTCHAGWDFQGLSGRWLIADTAQVAAAEPAAQVAVVEPPVRRRVSPPAVAACVTGCALIAAGVVAGLGDVDERLVWWLAVVVGAAAVVVLAGAWLARQIEDRRYRHNEVLGVVEARWPR